MMPTAVYVAAAVADIAGGFAFWAWLRLDKTTWWIVPGIINLVLFAWLLTRIDSDFAGRAYAAYRGVCIAAASLLWLWVGRIATPRSAVLTGATFALSGTMKSCGGRVVPDVLKLYFAIFRKRPLGAERRVEVCGDNHQRVLAKGDDDCFLSSSSKCTALIGCAACSIPQTPSNLVKPDGEPTLKRFPLSPISEPGSGRSRSQCG